MSFIESEETPEHPSLTMRQRGVLLAVFAGCFLLSFLWWKHNPNQTMLLALFPDWGFRGYVIYDGYGNYAEMLRAFFASPSRETLDQLTAFTDNYIHTIRPLYPLMVALVALLIGDVLISSVIVTIASVAFCIWAFHLLAVRTAEGCGTALFHMHLLFVSHVAVIGMLARPMADPLALGFLLLSMEMLLRLVESRSAKAALVLLLVFALALLAKTVSVILLAAVGLAFLRFSAEFWRSHWGKVAMGSGALIGVAAVLILTIRALPATSATWEFLLAFFRGVTQFPTDPNSLLLFGKAAILFLVLALQIHPVFAFLNPVWRRVQWEGGINTMALAARLHVWWIIVYIAQRFVFYGFNLDHSRARYGLPLVASMILLSYPGIRNALGPRKAAWLVAGLVAANIAVFGGTLLRALL